MKQRILDFLHRYRWLIFAAAVAAIALWVVVVGFGEQLGVDPGVRATVDNAAKRTWAGLMTLFAATAFRDADGDGTPDILQGDRS